MGKRDCVVKFVFAPYKDIDCSGRSDQSLNACSGCVGDFSNALCGALGDCAGGIYLVKGTEDAVKQ